MAKFLFMSRFGIIQWLQGTKAAEMGQKPAGYPAHREFSILKF